MVFLHRPRDLILAVVLIVSCCICTGALQVTQSDVTFSSQSVETHLVLKKDSSLPVDQGIVFGVVLNGPRAPQIAPEDVLYVDGGYVEVRAMDSYLSMAQGLRQPSVFMITAIVCVLRLIVGPKFKSPLVGAFVFSLALLLSTSISLQQFESSWSLEVTATVPASYNLESLQVNILRGSIRTDADMGTSINKLNVDLCKSSGNQVTLDGFTLTQTTVCASNQVVLRTVTLPEGSSMEVTSLEHSGSVFVKDSFLGSFSSTSSNGVAMASACADPTLSQLSTSRIIGHCGQEQPHVTIVAHLDAILSAADKPLEGAKRWSDPQTWGGELPKDGEKVIIAQDQVIMLDTETASLGNLEIRGTLVADPEKNFWVIAESISLYGTLRVGWLSAPYTKNGTFTLTGAKGNYTSRAPLNAFSNSGVSRGIIAYPGSQLQLHGSPPRTTYTRLNDHAAQNDTVLTVDSVAGWKVGDEIVISPTTFPSTSQSDLRRIVAINNVTNQVTIDKGLSYARWGKIQYITDKGISLEPGVFKEYRAHPDIADVLDERAVIVHLTRNIVIEGLNDTNWQQGHGVHVMWMGVSTQVHLNGVEVRRAGQAGALGRYAIHAHMQSYNLPGTSTEPSDGKFVGDAKDVFVRNCAVHESVHRAIVIHGTCGARYVGNVAYDILGHAFFFEDGSEIRNHFIGNVVLNIRAPEEKNRILKTDRTPAGIWFTNGNNHLRDNIVGDNRNGFGLWNALAQRPIPDYVDIVAPNTVVVTPVIDNDDFGRRYNPILEKWELTAITPTVWSVVGSISGVHANATANGSVYNNQIIRITISGSATVGAKITFRIDGYVGGCFGQSRFIDLHPQFTPILDYTNNTGFACALNGAQSDTYTADELGNVASRSFITTNDSRPGYDHNNPKRVPTHFDRHRLWMNEGGAYTNRVYDPLYSRWICADNRGTDLRGATQYGKFVQGLLIGNSLNTLEPKLYTKTRHAFATYHFACQFHNISLFNYPAKIPEGNIYTERQLLDMPGAVESWDLYLSSIEMGAMKAAFNWKQFNVAQFERTPPPNIEYIYPNNSGGPDFHRRYWTFAGALYDSGVLAGKAGDYLIFDHPFMTYGLSNSRRVGRNISKTLATSDKFYGLQVRGSDTGDSAYEPVTFVRLDNNFQEVDRWAIDDGRKAEFLGIMRHASALKGGYYRVFNHGSNTPNSKFYQLQIRHPTMDATDTLVVGLPWSGAVTPKVSVWGKAVPAVTSRTTLLATPQSYWQDKATNQVWYHFQGGWGDVVQLEPLA